MSASLPGPCSVQIVIDAAEPHVLADWWAETLGWEVEPQDEEFIRSLIEQGHVSDEDTITHNGKLVFASATGVNAPGLPGSPRLYFQQVPEAKTVKNRIHLDVRPPTPPGERPDPDALDAFRAALLERGATEVGRGQQGAHIWVTFADPEGNEFCV